MTHTVTRWAISFLGFSRKKDARDLYCGQFETRKAAIEDHARAHLWEPATPELIQREWKKARARGDRAVKVQITWEESDNE